MPYRDLLKDPQVRQVLGTALITLIKYLPSIINHIRLTRVEKVLDGAYKAGHTVKPSRKRIH